MADKQAIKKAQKNALKEYLTGRSVKESKERQAFIKPLKPAPVRDIAQNKGKVMPKISLPTAQTTLQKRFEHKLSGAKFRWLNEQLYVKSSLESQKLVQAEDYDAYHAGFTQQAQMWPQIPVEKLAQRIAPGQIVADLGSGPGTLAKLLPDNRVYSFDLVAGDDVIAADVATHVPLDNASVDVVVCCLSLMATNWLGQIKESTRIARDDGLLLIAEVRSRIADKKAFIKLISAHGWRLQDQSETSHFVEMAFQRDEKQVDRFKADGSVLTPCLYKKR